MDTTSRRQERSQAGFTMIELLVVVGLIAIMAAFSLPGIARYIRNYRIRGAVNEVAGGLQQARVQAITNNVNYGVLFLPLTPTTYRVVKEDGLELPGDKQRIAGDRRPVSDLLDPLSVNQQAGTLQELPDDIVFADAGTGCPELTAAVPPWVPSVALALRFNRLGGVCKPAGAVEPCPQVDTGGAFFWERNNDVAVCLRETRSGLSRSVIVSPGGRIQIAEALTELNQ